MKYLILFNLIFISALWSQEEKEITLVFSAKFGQEILELEKEYQIDTNHYSISSLKFYLSNFRIHQNKETIQLKKEACLIDYSKPETSIIKIPFDSLAIPFFDSISFDLGIDSLTNVSGVYGGDLDPTKGMYWAWQSGYINFKLEGKSNLSPARKQEFHFHLGGYLPPFQNIQNLSFSITNSKLKLNLDLYSFFQETNLQNDYKVMSPGTKAVSKSKFIKNLFQIEK